MTRCFISIDIPEITRREIQKIQEQLPDFKGKLTEQENLHLTLKFLGEISDDEIEEIRKKLREIKSEKFSAEVDEVGVFSEDFIRIIWLHLKGTEELQKIIDEKLTNLFSKEKRFMSHLTIARVKNLRDKKYFLNELKKIKTPSVKFEVDNFLLKKSTLMPESPVYEIIEEYRLKNINTRIIVIFTVCFIFFNLTSKKL